METRSTMGWLTRWLFLAIVSIILFKFIGIGIVLAFIAGFFVGAVLSKPG